MATSPFYDDCFWILIDQSFFFYFTGKFWRQAKGFPNFSSLACTNNAFVTIGPGNKRYQTSVKEKASDPVQWNEECELWGPFLLLEFYNWLKSGTLCRSIPKNGNSAEIALTALHRIFIGDDFLGTIRIPLSDFDVPVSVDLYAVLPSLSRTSCGRTVARREESSRSKLPSSWNQGQMWEFDWLEQERESSILLWAVCMWGHRPYYFHLIPNHSRGEVDSLAVEVKENWFQFSELNYLIFNFNP